MRREGEESTGSLSCASSAASCTGVKRTEAGHQLLPLSHPENCHRPPQKVCGTRARITALTSVSVKCGRMISRERGLSRHVHNTQNARQLASRRNARIQLGWCGRGREGGSQHLWPRQLFSPSIVLFPVLFFPRDDIVLLPSFLSFAVMRL